MELICKYRNGKNCQFPQILATFILSLSGMSYGMLFCWTSPGIPEVIANASLNITLEHASYFVIIPQVAVILTAPIYSALINVIGRKMTAALIGVPQLFSWIITGISNNLTLFYIARFLSGIGDAGVYTVIPLYIGEVSEPLVRGSWGNTLCILIAIGKFFVILLGAYYNIQTTACIGAGMSLLYLALVFLIPESPYYLLMKNRDGDAKNSLSILRWRRDTEEELKKLKADVDRQMSETGTYKDLFTIKSNRVALMMGIGLRFALQYSGVTAFEAYAQYMFQQAGGIVSETTSAIIFSFAFIPGIMIFINVANRFERRKLTILSCIICAIALSTEALYFSVQQFSNLPLDDFTWFPLIGMVIYVIGCCFGMAFIPLLILSELFSASVKGKATAVITIFMAVNVMIVPKLFQVLTSNLGIFAPFVFFACYTIVSSLFCYFYVIETKGKTLEEIQQVLKAR